MIQKYTEYVTSMIYSRLPFSPIRTRTRSYLASPQTLPPCGTTITPPTQHISTNPPAFLNMPSQLAQTDAIPCTANQAHLAIKQAIALNAFGTLYTTSSKPSSYTSAGHVAASALSNPSFATIASTPSHFTLHYPNPDSKPWITACHLFPDILLNLNAFPTSTYASQSAFYPTVRDVAGVPVQSPVPDPANPWARTDIMLWAAATATNNKTRDMFTNDVHAYLVGNGSRTVPFGDRFYTGGAKAGMEWGWRARPVVGGHFAVMASEMGPNSILV